jgi:NAD(P)-dependent dehydrogenase (short-subunit alcohol dehydrogenase family)
MTNRGAILITGGARGLGAALTKHFAGIGRDVVMNYRSANLAERVSKEASLSAPGCVLAVEADVRDRTQVQAMFGKALAAFGDVTVLINCAGVNRDAPFLELTDKDWDTVVDTHLRGTFICSQEFVKHVGDKPGCIINLGAACGLQGRLNGANFCSAKGGVFALTKYMARELAPRIRVNCLTPSAVDTEEVRERYALDTEEGLNRVLSGLPMGRLGAHGDVVQMVECILGAEFTTGANFLVNGGEFMQ